MMPEERERVIIEYATRELVNRHWAYLKAKPRRVRLQLVQMVRDIVEQAYRREIG